MPLKFLKGQRDFGILIMRLGLGAMFVYHGAPKIMGGVDKWAGLGKAVAIFGINFMPAFWGFMASSSEFVGGILVFLGLYIREASVFLFITMVVATAFHFNRGDGLFGASHAIEVGAAFLSLVFIGAGKYSLDAKLGKD